MNYVHRDKYEITEKYRKIAQHKASAWGLLESKWDKHEKVMKWEYVDCIGEEDVLQRFCLALKAYAEECIEWHKHPTKMNISKQEESDF